MKPTTMTKAQLLDYVARLEDLVEDYDQVGFDNVCGCAEFSDSRCCWIMRSWQALQQWRDKHLGGRHKRLTTYIERAGEFLE